MSTRASAASVAIDTQDRPSGPALRTSVSMTSRHWPRRLSRMRPKIAGFHGREGSGLGENSPDVGCHTCRGIKARAFVTSRDRPARACVTLISVLSASIRGVLPRKARRRACFLCAFRRLRCDHALGVRPAHAERMHRGHPFSAKIKGSCVGMCRQTNAACVEAGVAPLQCLPLAHQTRASSPSNTVIYAFAVSSEKPCNVSVGRTRLAPGPCLSGLVEARIEGSRGCGRVVALSPREGLFFRCGLGSFCRFCSCSPL